MMTAATGGAQTNTVVAKSSKPHRNVGLHFLTQQSPSSPATRVSPVRSEELQKRRQSRLSIDDSVADRLSIEGLTIAKARPN
jgi:hypothetical protein